MHSSPIRIAALSVLASVFSLSTLALAQDSAAGTTEDITVTLGDIFEIQPSTDIADPAFSWILTQDRTFMQATRAGLFRFRFIEPKTYTLIGTVQSADQTQSLQRTFRIIVEPRAESGSTLPVVTGSATTLVTTSPALNLQNKIVIAEKSQILKIIPNSLDITPLALDMDLEKDSNGDGITTNDLDDSDTFFHSDATPLYIWMTDLTKQKNMSVTASAGEAGALQQTLEVLTEKYAQEQGLYVSPISIEVSPVSASEFSFAAKLDASVTSIPSLLYQWNFGDEQESLLTNPTHLFANSGTYTVILRVRDLQTGKYIGSATAQVVVSTGGVAATSSVSSASSSAVSETPAGPGLLSSLASWIPMIAILLVSLLIGALAVFLIARFRTRKPISDAFATMEAKILDTPDATAKNPPSLAIKKPIITATATEKKPEAQTPVPVPIPTPPADTKVAAVQTPPAAPVIDESKAPAWLKKGLDPNSVAAAPVATPKPVPPPAPQKPAQPKPVATPVPVATPAPAAAQTTPAPAIPKPPVPQAPSVPKPPVPQVPKPQPVATPKPAATPAVAAVTPPPDVPKPPVPQAPSVPKPPVPQAPKVPQPVVPTAPAVPTPVATPAPVVPMPQPAAPVAAPAPVVTPTPAAPAAMPVTPPAIPKPPVPQAPSVASTPQPVPPAPAVQVSTPVPAPLSTPAAAPVAAPKTPVTTATPVPPVPKPPVPQAPVAPATPTTPVPAPAAPVAPEQPAISPVPPVASKPLTEGQDEPIAFIRVEGLNPPPAQNPSQS